LFSFESALALFNTTLASNNSNSDTIKLALCIVWKEETEDIVEWIEYHQSIGVTNVIFMENNSTKSSVDILEKYIRSHFVIHYSYFIHQSTKYNNQLYAYDFCLKIFGSSFSHIGFIDSDEFIVVKNDTNTIIDVLNKYKDYGGLTLNWMFFGSSGHITRPSGGILKNYNTCVTTFLVKSIVNTKRTVSVSKDPHHFIYQENFYAVDTNYQPQYGPLNPSNRTAPSNSLYETCYINHYVLKSYEDFKNKHSRGSGTGMRKPMNFFNTTDKTMVNVCEFLSPRTNNKII
jgi:hypothetical protein